jgi:K+-transporting ATPase ATPase B chain
MTRHPKADIALFDRRIALAALRQASEHLNPVRLWRNPVIFATEITAILVTVLAFTGSRPGLSIGLYVQIALWLWLTVLFANFAEALAEGRGRARADSLRATQREATARRRKSGTRDQYETVPARALKAGDVVRIEAGELVPGDGEVIEGIASIDESAITGESAPVIREAGTDRSGVTGGTRIVSDWVVVEIVADAGGSYLDRLISLVESATRQKTPNEIALSLLLTGLTLLFLIVMLGLEAFANFVNVAIPIAFLGALFITLIPTTIGGLLSAIGIAGMDRLVKANVIAKSGRAVEAAGDVDTLLLDKTGTITYGNRLATTLLPLGGVDPRELGEAALLASLRDETAEGKSIVVLARKLHGPGDAREATGEFVPFSAHTRMSGANIEGKQYRKGAVDAVLGWLRERGANADEAAIRALVDPISRTGGTPLLVAHNARALGVIHLKDVVKPDIRERFAELRRMGIRTVMITGDNPLTAAAIAAEAGVDDFLAEATPERKLDLIRAEQDKGRLVAMCGDGSNDAPALAQADVGVAMNDGTAAAKEAANLIDLDSNPTKLIEVVMVGKQLLVSRGALTTFSIANDVAKYFAIIPAICVAAYPQLEALDVMQLNSPSSAILSALIFNALIIVALVPLALRGVNWRARSASALLTRNLLVYGLGGLVAPFIGIKFIDVVVGALGLA